MDDELLEPIMRPFVGDEMAQKAKYGGEMYVLNPRDVGKYPNPLERFQRDRNGEVKGIIKLDLMEINDERAAG